MVSVVSTRRGTRRAPGKRRKTNDCGMFCTRWKATARLCLRHLSLCGASPRTVQADDGELSPKRKSRNYSQPQIFSISLSDKPLPRPDTTSWEATLAGAGDHRTENHWEIVVTPFAQLASFLMSRVSRACHQLATPTVGNGEPSSFGDINYKYANRDRYSTVLYHVIFSKMAT